MARDTSSENESPGHAAMNSGLGMAAMMMLCCLAVVFLVALLPALGWPLGLIAGVVGGAALLFAHAKFMNHGRH